VTDLREHPQFHRLGPRAEGFLKAFEHLNQFSKGLIVETGTVRIEDNWEGDGQSTLLWDWYLSRNPLFNAISIDNDPVTVSRAIGMVSNVTVLEFDSVKALSALPRTTASKIVLLYLDSFNWSFELHLDSSFHHLAELAAIYASLPGGCMIMVDDRHTEKMGKHFMVEMFFRKLGIDPCYKGYQIAWIKPFT
jgi:hypothetical protein